MKYALPGILALALFVRLAALTFGLPLDLFGDEFVHVVTALSFLSDHTIRALNPLSYAPSGMAILLAPMIGIYGIGGILVHAFPGLEGFKDFAILNAVWFLAPLRLISALCGTGAVFLIYKISKRFVSMPVALATALIAASDFWLVHESSVGHFWMAAVALALLSFYFLIHAVDAHSNRQFIYAALSLVGSFWLGYFAILIVPFFVLALCHVYRSQIRRFVAPLGVLVVGFFVVAYVNPLSFFHQFGHAIRGALSVIGMNVFPEHAYATDVTMHPIANAIYLSKILFFDNPLLFVFGIIGLFILAKNYRRFDAQLIVGFPVLYFFAALFIWSDPDNRYVLPIFPMLMIGAGYLLEKGTEQKLLTRSIAIGLSCFVILYGITSTFLYASLLQKGDTRLMARNWMVHNAPEGARVLIDARYLELPRDRATIVFLEKNDPAALRTKDRLVLEKNLPLEKGFASFDIAESSKLKMKTDSFDYIIVGHFGEESVTPIPSSYMLVKAFEPTNGTSTIDDMVLNPLNPLNNLVKIDKLGPYVEIFSRVGYH